MFAPLTRFMTASRFRTFGIFTHGLSFCTIIKWTLLGKIYLTGCRGNQSIRRQPVAASQQFIQRDDRGSGNDHVRYDVPRKGNLSIGVRREDSLTRLLEHRLSRQSPPEFRIVTDD